MHREFRRILQIKMKLKIKFEAKIALSCYSYNHLEQANLYNKSPFSILFGFEPDFCNLLIESHDFKDSKDNYETVPIDPVPLWVDHLQSLHRDIGHRRFNLHSSTIENIIEKIEKGPKSSFCPESQFCHGFDLFRFLKCSGIPKWLKNCLEVSL